VLYLSPPPSHAEPAVEIISFCRDRLAHFKAPKSVVFGPLATTATGKVQKFTLREREILPVIDIFTPGKISFGTLGRSSG
jgi:acyl-CoA synthetase (AMP-forming)/AMP-acid ligase II